MDEGWGQARRRDALWTRAGMMQAIRRFFLARGYLEIETPVRIPAPAPETHIDTPSSEGWYLQSSPELCMKRLLAAGYPKLYQICKCFRASERGDRHLPEFTMLEWYRQGADYSDLMDECAALIRSVAQDLGTGGQIPFRGGLIDLSAPWERQSVAEAFDRHATLSLADALAADRFDEVMALEIEPRLGTSRPTFLFDYPAAMAALARIKEQDPTVAERFELYMGGIELANGFSELTDAPEQRRRFEAALLERASLHKAPSPMPERFLEALPFMPEAAGIALGLDRLAMVLTDSPTIDAVVAFTPEEL